MAFPVPTPRSSPEFGTRDTQGTRGAPAAGGAREAAAITAAVEPGEALARWYERELGWTTAGRAPVRLPTGLRFDVLELPAVAGRAVLRRVGRTGPVALTGARMQLLVAAGSAEELPGLLDWLEWGGITLGLTALGAGGRITAPAPAAFRAGSPGAALWLRPPGPRHEVEPALPALAGFGSSGGGAPDLVRLVDTAATECHRVRLLRARAGLLTDGPAAQPLAFS
ncbi:SCO3374 family protein [Streptomyces sp. BE147]|uniref:SCO3374 family protein n=1 Tax=unclassified Streptomyces TaxID=2593676 RepID=UPI002E7A490A|nr:SCO3374 family protein [Streptomyces sp. BE147]MEE1738160.1 SCO3374 family protein [Streptomyces sp. BE147]